MNFGSLNQSTLLCRQVPAQWALIPDTDLRSVPGLASGRLCCGPGSGLFLCHWECGPEERHQVLQTGSLGKTAGPGLQVSTHTHTCKGSCSHGTLTHKVYLWFRGHLSKGQMKELTPAQVASLPKATVISRLRFIPKTDGMRPITRVIGADAKTRVHFD